MIVQPRDPGCILLVDDNRMDVELKAAPGLRRIPVIVLTSSREEGDLFMSYDIGANSYLVKPVSFKAFLDVVKLVGSYWLTLTGPQRSDCGKDPSRLRVGRGR